MRVTGVCMIFGGIPPTGSRQKIMFDKNMFLFYAYVRLGKVKYKEAICDGFVAHICVLRGVGGGHKILIDIRYLASVVLVDLVFLIYI